MPVRSTVRLVLVLLLVPIFYFQCMKAGVPPQEPPPPHKCPPANPKRFKPEITVDEKTLTANPRVAVIWDVEPEDPTGEPPFKPSNRPVKITWKTQNKFNLVVTFTTPNCPIDPPQCNGQGQCIAQVKPPVAENIRCTYEMKNGDNVEVEISGIGVLRNPVVAEVA